MSKSRKWTEAELEIFFKEYPRANLEDLAKKLDRTVEALIRKAGSYPELKRDKSYTYSVQVRKPRKDDWTDSELAELKKMYWDTTNEKLENHFKRTIKAIKTKAIKEGYPRNIELAYSRRPHVRADGWSTEEHNLLEKLFQQCEFIEDLYRIFRETYPSRTPSAIYSRIKAKKMFDMRSTSLKSMTGGYWSAEDLTWLVENYKTKYWSEIERQFPNREKKEIRRRAISLGLYRPEDMFWREGMWTEEDLQDLYKMWPESLIEEIFDRFPDRSYQSIKKKAYEAGIKRLVKNSTSEILMKRLLDEVLLGEEHIDNGRYNWLQSPTTGAKMELDRYYPDLKLAFEYDGEQHYSADAFYRIASTRGQNITIEQAQKEFDHYVANDKAKQDICKKLNINLIKIRYDEELDQELIRGKMTLHDE